MFKMIFFILWGNIPKYLFPVLMTVDTLTIITLRCSIGCSEAGFITC